MIVFALAKKIDEIRSEWTGEVEAAKAFHGSTEQVEYEAALVILASFERLHEENPTLVERIEGYGETDGEGDFYDGLWSRHFYDDPVTGFRKFACYLYCIVDGELKGHAPVEVGTYATFDGIHTQYAKMDRSAAIPYRDWPVQEAIGVAVDIVRRIEQRLRWDAEELEEIKRRNQRAESKLKGLLRRGIDTLRGFLSKEDLRD